MATRDSEMPESLFPPPLHPSVLLIPVSCADLSPRGCSCRSDNDARSV